MSASTNTTIPQIRLPFILDQPVKSRIIARIFSQTPKTVDIAANTINRKKSEPHILPPYTFESLDPDFSKKAQPGDLIVAGENFGCGSSREQAPSVLNQQDVAQVGVARAAQVRVAEADDGGVAVLIAGTILVGLALIPSVHVVRDGIGVRAEL